MNDRQFAHARALAEGLRGQERPHAALDARQVQTLAERRTKPAVATTAVQVSNQAFAAGNANLAERQAQQRLQSAADTASALASNQAFNAADFKSRGLPRIDQAIVAHTAKPEGA